MLFLLSRRIDAVLVALKQNDETNLDSRIEDALQKAIDNYNNAKAKIERKKQDLPKIELWDIALKATAWERELINDAEKLRYLITEAYGIGTPDEYHVRSQADVVPMTYRLAHALAETAHTEIDIAIKHWEWMIEISRALFESKRSCPDFENWASCEAEACRIANAIRKLEERLPAMRQQLWSEFKQALNSSTAETVTS
jgi:hypothetical protein